MGARLKRYLALLLVFSLVNQLLLGCSKQLDTKQTGNVINEMDISESFVNEQSIEEEKLKESYILENLLYEDGIYEYQINEQFISQAYTFEIVVGELSKEELQTQLPVEVADYDIDWPKVLGKFAVGTSIIVVVGVVNYISMGSTYFVFGSPAEVAKDAIVGGAIGVALNEVFSAAKDGKLVEPSAKKYAIEGFADGYMWGAVSSVLKINCENRHRLKALKLATGDSAKIKVSGEVFNNAGQVIGKAYFDNKQMWHLVDESSQVVHIFNVAGKEIGTVTGTALPANAKLALGTATEALICYTDEAGQIIRIGNKLQPNLIYTLSGHTYYTDKKGRITKVVLNNLKLKTEGRERKLITNTMDDIGRGFATNHDDRGHLIADWFDGDNSLANIVAMDSTVNRGKVAQIEASWAKCLQQGGQVKGTIEVSYNNSSFRPDSFNYSYDTGAGLISKIIPNG